MKKLLVPGHGLVHLVDGYRCECGTPLPDRLLGSHRQNMADKAEKGRGSAGEAHSRVAAGRKLTTDEVDAIRQRRANGEPLAAIAADLPVSVSQVHRIATGELWRWWP